MKKFKTKLSGSQQNNKAPKLIQQKLQPSQNNVIVV